MQTQQSLPEAQEWVTAGELCHDHLLGGVHEAGVPRQLRVYVLGQGQGCELYVNHSPVIITANAAEVPAQVHIRVMDA